MTDDVNINLWRMTSLLIYDGWRHYSLNIAYCNWKGRRSLFQGIRLVCLLAERFERTLYTFITMIEFLYISKVWFALFDWPLSTQQMPIRRTINAKSVAELLLNTPRVFISSITIEKGTIIIEWTTFGLNCAASREQESKWGIVPARLVNTLTTLKHPSPNRQQSR